MRIFRLHEIWIEYSMIKASQFLTKVTCLKKNRLRFLAKYRKWEVKIAKNSQIQKFLLDISRPRFQAFSPTTRGKNSWPGGIRTWERAILSTGVHNIKHKSETKLRFLEVDLNNPFTQRLELRGKDKQYTVFMYKSMKIAGADTGGRLAGFPKSASASTGIRCILP